MYFVLEYVCIFHKCHLRVRTCGQTLGFGLPGSCCCCCCCGCVAEDSILLGLVGTITTGNEGAGGGWLFFPVNILTVLCKKSVFWPLELASDRFDVDDIEWHRTTNGALPPDQSLLPLVLLVLLLLLFTPPPTPIEPSSPAELDRYGGGDSDSRTVRFGGGRMHFWHISDS